MNSSSPGSRLPPLSATQAIAETRLESLHVRNQTFTAARTDAAGCRGDGRRTGLNAFGGTNAPYIWVKAPGTQTSWEIFDKILHELQVGITPGSGFGAEGEGYFRVSAFNGRENAEEVARRFAGLTW